MAFDSSPLCPLRPRVGFFNGKVMTDGLVKSRKFTNNVMPVNPGSVSGAGAGIREYHLVTKSLDPGFGRGDDFLRV